MLPGEASLYIQTKLTHLASFPPHLPFYPSRGEYCLVILKGPLAEASVDRSKGKQPATKKGLSTEPSVAAAIS